MAPAPAMGAGAIGANQEREDLEARKAGVDEGDPVVLAVVERVADGAMEAGWSVAVATGTGVAPLLTTAISPAGTHPVSR